MPQRQGKGIGSGASTAISRETALLQLGILDPNPSKEQIQQAYQRMAVKWYEYYVHLWRNAGLPCAPAVFQLEIASAAPPADTLKCCERMFPRRHPDWNLGEDTTTQMLHINNAYHRLLPDKGGTVWREK